MQLRRSVAGLVAAAALLAAFLPASASATATCLSGTSASIKLR